MSEPGNSNDIDFEAEPGSAEQAVLYFSLAATNQYLYGTVWTMVL